MTMRRLLLSQEFHAETQVAIWLLFCERSSAYTVKTLLNTLLRDVYAKDIVVLNQQDMLEIVASKEPAYSLRRFVISQVSLAAVAPYTITGPTPAHFFFGREHELREISTGIAITSYVIIGGRRIGKTS